MKYLGIKAWGLILAVFALLVILDVVSSQLSFLSDLNKLLSPLVIDSVDGKQPVLSTVALVIGFLFLLAAFAVILAHFGFFGEKDEVELVGEKDEVELVEQSETVEGYPRIQWKFREKILSDTKPSDRTVKVYGFTFAGFWILLNEVLRRRDLRNWTIHLYYTSPRFILENRTLFQEHWYKHAQEKEQEMIDWFSNDDNKKMLADRSVKILIRAHTVFPVVHGKIWGDGTCFIHVAQWGSPTDGIQYPGTFHEIFPSAGGGKRAEHYTALLQNWAEKYEACYDRTIVNTI